MGIIWGLGTLPLGLERDREGGGSRSRVLGAKNGESDGKEYET